MSLQNTNLIDNSKNTTRKYDMNELSHSERAQLNAESKSKSHPFIIEHDIIDDSSPQTHTTLTDPMDFGHFRPNKHIPNDDVYDEDEEDLINHPKYLAVKEKLKQERVTLSDMEYLESKLHQLADINFDSAMMRILQHKIEQAHNGYIKNKGIHKTEAPPYAFYDEDQMELPKTKKFKLKLNEMNRKLYTENRIEWMDYIKLKEDDSVDYRNDQGKFVVAKVMEKDGVELVLYTKEGQTVMINFLNQYPYQRLFKSGAVTARIPKKIRRKSVEIGSQIRLLCDTDFIMDSKWTKMECKVVDRDIDHDLENDENDDIPKQIQIEFILHESHDQTNTLSHTNGDHNDHNNKIHRMWVHLDNTEKLDDIDETEPELGVDSDDNDVETIVINGKRKNIECPKLNQCCVVL